MIKFKNAQESHRHSLETLELLYEYDDFMESVGSVIDFGSGADGLDAIWWATRTTRDETPIPLNIKVTTVDICNEVRAAKNTKNVTFQRGDFENLPDTGKLYDVLWCHDAFQYAINPLQTLREWRKVAAKDSLLVLILPQTTNLVNNQQEFETQDQCFYHHTMVSLLHMLAMTGWDCSSGHFYKSVNDPWLCAAVYNSDQPARDPKTTRLYDLVDSGLLPESAVKGINRYGYLRQQDLVLPWLDKNFIWMGKH